jgi:hypothetical protein
MATADASIFLQQRAPDILGGLQEGMKLKDMVRQNKVNDQAQQFNQTLKGAYTPDPTTGQLKFDNAKLSDLAQIDPQKAFALQQQQRSDQVAAQKAEMESHQLHLGISAQLLGGATDEASYQGVKKQLEAKNYFDPGQLPANYDPKAIDRLRQQSLSLQDQLKQKNTEFDQGIAAGGAKTKQQEADAATSKASTEAARLPIYQQEANAKIQENSIRNAERKDAHGNQQMQQVQSMLESARGNPEVMQAQKDRYAADKLNGMLGDDPNKLSPQMVQLAASEVAKIATGGVPQSAELQHLTPSSLPGSLAQAAQYFTNSPNAASQGAFLQQYQKYANDLKDNANNVIKDKYSRVIESRRAGLGKDNADTLTAQYLDPLKSAQKKAAGGASHPQDDQAVAWAKSNMNDPRSVAILKANGVK